MRSGLDRAGEQRFLPLSNGKTIWRRTTAMAQSNKSWRLVSRPENIFTTDNFSLTEAPVPDPEAGQIVVRNLYLSLDPTNRIWAREETSYLPPVPLGGVMRGLAIGRVVKSKNPAFPEGALVSGILGWEQYSVSDGTFVGIVAQPPQIPLSARFALFEHIGTPAYFGLADVGGLQKGETVVVSAAAGAVGSLAVQMARNLGAGRVVGLAGSDSKCRWVKDELGADAVINYKKENIPKALAAACPGGIDVYFDNTGGEILEAVLDLINMKARIPICGGISSYDNDCRVPGPRNLFNLLFKRARMEGFVCFDYAADPEAWARCHEDITDWHLGGKLKYRLDLHEGIEMAPQAVIKLFTGANVGKVVVKVAEESAA
jgi:NADPH-dependent curcumin reductase CurA